MLSMWITGGGSWPSLFTLQSIVEDVHPQEEDQVDKAWKNYWSPKCWNSDENARKKGKRWRLAFDGELEKKIKTVLKENKIISRR